MLAYDDISTYTFVLLYNENALTHAQSGADAGSILRKVGVQRQDGEPLLLDLAAVAGGAEFQNPTIATHVECKKVPGLGDPVIELQVGAGCYLARGLFDVGEYLPKLRDRLVEMVGDLVALDGFEVGFSVYLGDDENEIE